MSNVIKVSVKWGKQNFPDLEMDLDQDAITFKSQLYALTNVLVDKQKLMSKGKVIQDGDDLKNFKLKTGSKLLLMGTADDGAAKATTEVKPVVFLEDLSSKEIAKIYQEETGEALPCGLINLGNTCYMNSVIQNLRRVNELKNALGTYQGQMSSANLAEQYTVAAKNLFNDLDTAGDAVFPGEFVNTVRTNFPLFAERDSNQAYKQQDAEEYLNTFLQTVESTLKTNDAEGNAQSLVKQLFNVEFELKTTNTENPEEVEVSIERSNKVTCHIDVSVNHLHEGIKLSFEGEISKMSPSLGRDALYNRVYRINKLPSYLVVQFLRFRWKKADASSGTKETETKILRNVSFPKCLDIFDLCSDSLKENLKPGRDFQIKQKDKELEKILEEKKQQEEESKKNEDGPTRPKKKKEPAIEGAPDHILYKEHGSGLDTGNYQLVSVVTHQGRSLGSGHYVGWVHNKGDEWLEYNDDIVRRRKTEDIMNLRGGGDWHMAYLCIYRKVETHNDEEVEGVQEEGEKMEQDQASEFSDFSISERGPTLFNRI